MRTLALPRPAADLLPHRSPMLLLDEVTDYGEGTARASVAIPRAHPFATACGRLEATTLIEMLAQATAALKGCEAEVKGDSAPRTGFLVGLKRLRINAPARVGDSLSVEVRRIAALGQATVMEGRVLRGDDCLAAGTMNVWEELATEFSNERPLSDSSHSPSNPIVTGPIGGRLSGRSDSEHVSPMHRAVWDCASPSEPGPDKNEAAGDFCFGESFIGFQGHFPGFPVLPGVVMLKAVLLLCDGLMDHAAELVDVERAKFAGQVRPGRRIRARVRLSPVADKWRVEAVIVEPRTDALILKLSATVVKAEASGVQARSK